MTESRKQGEPAPRKGPPGPGDSGGRKGPPRAPGSPGTSGGHPRPAGGPPPAPPPRPAGRPATGPAPRPPEPTTPPAGGEPTTPVAQSDSDDELIFMTHAPGATVAPRPMLEAQVEVKAFEERLKAKEDEKKAAEKAEADAKAEKARRRAGTGGVARPARESAEPARASSARVRLVEGAARLSEGAGMGAIARTLHAARGTTSAPEAPAPAFWPSVPGALLCPLRRGSLAALLGGTILLFGCLLLIEVSPRVGLVACAVAALELIALRVRWIRDAAGGKDDASWPSWADVVGSFPLHAAACFVLAPAIILALAAYGPKRWDATHDASVPARIGRVWSPPTEGAVLPDGTPAPGAPPDQLGRHALGMLGSLVGPARPADEVDRRDARELARDLQDASLARLRTLVSLEGLPPISMVWRGLLVLGLVSFPMALLAAARLKSAYVPLYPPVLLRGVLRGPIAYTLVVAVWLACVAAVLTALLFLPGVLHARLATLLAHAGWALVVAALVVTTSLVHGALLGRFYRSHSHQLGWE